MNEYSTFEKIYTFLIILAIFIMGIQVGIFQGKELQRQGYYEYSISN
jgi:hypothetical protein